MERLYVVEPPEEVPKLSSVTLTVGQLLSLDIAEGVVYNEYGSPLFVLVGVNG